LGASQGRSRRDLLGDGPGEVRKVGLFPTPWLPEANEQNAVVTQAAAAAAGRYAAGGFTTVYDGMVGPWFLPTFLNATAWITSLT
jgi:hypothetical protein